MANDGAVAWRAEEFDVDDVPGMLSQLGELMDRRGERRSERLLPGLSEDQIRSTLHATTGLEVHPDLVAWFQWTAGPVIEDDWFFMSRKCCRPLRFSSILEVMRVNDGEFLDEPYRSGSWIPFLDFGVMDCSATELRGAVLNCWGHYGIDIPYVDRLGVLVWWWIAQRVEGVLAFDPEVESGESFNRRTEELRDNFVVMCQLALLDTEHDVAQKIDVF